MNLPRGVTYNAGVSRRLIAIGEQALVTIPADPGEYDAHVPYVVSDWDFEADFKRLFSEDYCGFDRRYHLVGHPKEDLPIYSGAQHGSNDDIPDPKLPNITVIPDVLTSHARIVALRFGRTGETGNTIYDDFRMPTGQEVTLFGCSMGHWHEEANCPDGIQEIYELQGYGALAIDRPESDEVELWVGRDGDKIVVPHQCHMTLYNLDDTEHPLITLDFAHPGRNHTNQESVGRSGPVLMAYYTAHEAVFVLNAWCINRDRKEFPKPASAGRNNRECLNGGVRLAGPPSNREVRIPLGTRSGLGRQIYEALTGEVDVIADFLHLGIRVRRASPIVRVGDVWYSNPLVECVKPNRGLYHHFMGGQPSGNPDHIPSPERPLHEGEQDWSGDGPRTLEPGRKPDEMAQLAIPILIEGAGDWVEKAIIPAVKDHLDGEGTEDPRLTVTIADDSRWNAPGVKRPVPPSSSRYPETRRFIDEGKVFFFDKAYPPHFRRYQRLLPAVVFIVTPDYTHSALSREYLDRAHTVFVEKPFDANYDNVRELLEARGLARLDTEIYALDHYRFYAWRLKERTNSGHTLLAEATDWLGGRLREARFCMVESNPVEPHRVRAVQFGLMLDMLPHCFAMLAFFGKLDSVDELQLLDVRRYAGAPIASETYAHVAFTFEDYSDNGWRVPCQAWVGKGLKKDRKYFEVTGVKGNSVLVAFGDRTHWWHPQLGDQEIEGGIFLVDEQGALEKRAELDRDRYKQLIADMVNGTRQAIVCAMPLGAGAQIVQSLDSIWNAIQSHSPWRPYEVGELDCQNIRV